MARARADEDRERISPRKPLVVGRTSERLERVRRGEDAGGKRDLRLCGPVRVALPVPTLVVRANHLHPRPLEEG